MFSGSSDDLATAIGVLVEAVMLAVFCLVCWKIGWTKAPPDENLCAVIYNSYEVEEQDVEEQEVCIEVVLGSGDDKQAPIDLIFEQTDGGVFVVDNESLHCYQEKTTKPRGGAGSDEITVESNDLSQEEASSSDREGASEHGRLGRTISALKARATGYRQPARSSERAYGPDPRILSALDEESEELDLEGGKAKKNYTAVPRISPEKRPDDISIPAQGKSID